MATINLKLENPQQIEQLRHHLNQRVSGAIITSGVHDAFGGDTHSDGHHVQIQYSGNPEEIKQAMHHGFNEMGHQDWEHRFNARFQ